MRHSVFRGVIFDLDGTLIDSLRDIAEAANKALAGEGLPPHELDEYRYLVGEGVQILMERAIPRALQTPEVVKRCMERFRTHYQQGWHVHTRPYPGVEQLLEQLRQRQIPTAVLSNKPHDFTQMCVARFFPSHAFRVVLGVREGATRKPDPAGALWIGEQLGIESHQLVFLGDTRIDMLTARAAGMLPVGASWGFRETHELIEAGAVRVLDRPLDLLELLDNHCHMEA
ncbi:MAG: phosphoglycolate phosphatase [Pirellulaceae bacterium]|nr:MAG: phosphoglycolate phosphatase [Pirellulaceae bacterium]